MSVSVDLRPLSNSHSRRGIGRYVRGLLDPIPAGCSPITEIRRPSRPRALASAGGITLVLPERPRMRLDPFGARLVRRALESSETPAAHLTDPYGYLWAPRDRPVLVTVYDLLLFEGEGRLAGLLTRGLTALAQRTDVTWLAISETTRRELFTTLGVAGGDIVVIPPGATSWPDAAPIVEDCLLFVGALDEHKQPDHALAAGRAAALPVRYVGRQLPGAAARFGLPRSALLPAHNDAQLGARIKGARAVIHPSRQEGFGLVVLEALSLGTPVIAYDLPVTREIVGPDYPLVPLEHGPDGLGALARTLEGAEERARLVAVAAPHLDRFSWAAGRTRLAETYRGLG